MILGRGTRSHMLRGMAAKKKENTEWPESGYFQVNPHDANIPFELVSHESSG